MPSTYPTYKEEWTVVVGKDKFIITGEQQKELKRLTEEGNRAMVWFGDYAVSIPHIQAVYLNWRKRDQKYLQAGEDQPLSAAQIKRNRAMNEKIIKTIKGL